MDNAQVEAVARDDIIRMALARKDDTCDDLCRIIFAQAAAIEKLAAIGPSEYERGFQAAKEAAEQLARAEQMLAKDGSDLTGFYQLNAQARSIATAISNMEPVK